MMVYHLFDWTCSFDNPICTTYAKHYFDKVKNETYGWDGINVNYRYILNNITKITYNLCEKK